MAKTRSQVASVRIKEEEEDGKVELKHSQLLNGASIATKRTSKIDKRKNASQIRNTISSVLKIKQEQKDESKILRPVPTMTDYLQRQKITKEQVEKLIGYVVNSKMSVAAAARKVNISKASGNIYYNRYLKDPERKIPVPSTARSHKNQIITYDQVKKLIGYIVDDKMTIYTASKKVNMCRQSGTRYYQMYLNDPKKEIPIPGKNNINIGKLPTQRQIKDVISYIVDDKMSIQDASMKANIADITTRKYYMRYLEDPKHEIPVPKTIEDYTDKRCTQDQVNDVIGYLVNDKMSLKAASAKANMSTATAKKYYNKYLNDPDHNIPSRDAVNHANRVTQDQINKAIGYLVDDKMSILSASIKANMGYSTVKKYYAQYLNDPDRKIPLAKKPYVNSKRCTQNQVKQVIGYIVDDKMSIKDAADKVKMSGLSARMYYYRYLEDPNHQIPVTLDYTISTVRKEQAEKLIDYVVNDKMNLIDAAKKVNMTKANAYRYYNIYRRKSPDKIPALVSHLYTK